MNIDIVSHFVNGLCKTMSSDASVMSNRKVVLMSSQTPCCVDLILVDVRCWILHKK